MSEPNSWVPPEFTGTQTPPPMVHGQATPAPMVEQVYPAGDPKIDADPRDDGSYPVDPNGYTDLTTRKPRPKFRIGSELYEGKVEVAAGVLMKYGATMAAKAKQQGSDGQDHSEEEFRDTVQLFRLLLKKDSAERLVGHVHLIPEGASDADVERIMDEADADEDTVGMETFMNLMPWLMEQYGMAPTEPSSSASDGSPTSPDDGSASTQTSPNGVSTSGTSPSTAP